MQSYGGAPAPVPPKGNPNVKVLVALGAVVLGVLLGAAGYLVMRDDATQADGPTPTTEADERSQPRPTRTPTTEPLATEPPTTEPATTEAPRTDTTAAPAGDTETTEAPADTTPSTPAPASDGSTSIEGAILWTSTDGTASMEIAPSWSEMSIPGALMAWSINASGAPEANLNIMTGSAGAATTQDYIDAGVSNLDTIGDIEVLDSGIITAADGTEIGFIESRGEVSTAPGMDLHFYMTFNIANGQVAQATFTASEEHWTSVIDGVRPYMETITAV